VAKPPADPLAPEGFQLIPQNATLQQAIQIMNHNFQRFLQRPFNGSQGQRGQQGQQGQNAQKGNWVLDPTPEPTKKVRIYQKLDDGTKNKDNFVDVLRVTSTRLKNKVTGEIMTIPGVHDPEGG
jgi:hypothetical protein